MNRPEAVILVRYVRAICPQQKFDEYTPDVWHDLLGEYSLADCQGAARSVGQKQPFISPSEIIAEVRRVRDERIDAAVVVYDGQPDESGAQFAASLRSLLRAAGDGHLGTRTARQAIPDRRPLELEAGPQGRLQQALAAIGTMPPRITPGVANPRAVSCPKCSAPPGKPCVRPSGIRIRDPHPSRIDHARQRAGQRADGAA